MGYNVRKSLAVAILTGIVFAALGAPMTAQSKTKELKLFLRWDDDGAGGCGATYLSPEDAPDAGSGCAFIFQPAQEVFAASGQPVLTHEWPGLLEKPVTIKAGKAVGSFMVSAYVAAQSTLELELRASTANGSVTIGSFVSDPFNVAPTQMVPVEFELDIPKALVNKKITSLSMSTTFRGASAQTYIELDNPAAYITLPVK